MFCKKCGTAIDEDAAFCPECGALMTENDLANVTQKKKTGWIIGLSVAGGVLAFLLLIGVISLASHNKYIDLVKNGCPMLYPDTTYNEALTSFFSEPKWEYFKSDDDEDIVEFRGKCSILDSDVAVKMTIQFAIDKDDDVSIHTLALDGKKQSDFLAVLILAGIFEKYEDGNSDGKLEMPDEDENADISEDDFSSGTEEGYEDAEYGEDEDFGIDMEAYKDSVDTDDYFDDAMEDDGDYYIFEGSDTRILKNSELKGCDAETLRLGRNEIYARHGRRFLDAELQSYFDSMPWYEGIIEPEDFKESVLNKYEKKNLKKITRYENR